MTPKNFSGVVLAFMLGFSAHAMAQEAPEGYTSLDQYGQEAPKKQEAAAEVPLDLQSRTYSVEFGASFRETLDAWLQQVGWQKLSWKLPPDTDFTLGGRGDFKGDFVTATTAFVNSLGKEAKIHVHFNKGNRLLVVSPRP